MRDALDRAFATLSGRPWVAVGLLCAGVIFGVVLRGGTAGEAPPVTQPAAEVRNDSEPDEPPEEPEDDQKKNPEKKEPEVAPGPDGAASAIDDYQQSVGDGTQVGAEILPFSGEGGAAGGNLDSGPPWSVMKVPAAAAYLNFRRAAEGATSGASTLGGNNDLELALIQSDNLGIRRPVQEMMEATSNTEAADAINLMLSEGEATGIISPVIDPTINSLQLGTGTWSLDEAAEWFRQLQVGADCLGLSEEDRSYILELLERAPSVIDWGASAALDSDDDFALKPGWGPSESFYTTEQLVIVGNGDGPGYPSSEDGYVMAIMAQVPGTSDSSFQAGQDHLEDMAGLISEAMGTPSGSAKDFSGTC